ncbi:MAG: hypothetical protein KIS74_03730 [Burkholderiales bacterium]|nr:hypothetical protein [Burkholderiales bacterium]
MMLRRSLVVAAIGLLALAPACLAETFRLEDPASQVFPPNAHWEWAPGSLRTGINTVHMNLRVEVRIDTRAWAGRQGRIYMVLPVDAGGPVTAEWTTQGRLLGGRLVSGERALVYSGAIPGPALEDTLRVHLATDARQMTTETQRLAFHFELDTP